MLVRPESNSRPPTSKPDAQPTEPPEHGVLICLVCYNIVNNTHEKITWFWLGESSAVQVWHLCKKCNTGAKSVTPVQITHRNSGLWFAERHWESCRPMISCKRQWPKFCTETLKKFFSNAKKRASWNIFRHFFHVNLNREHSQKLVYGQGGGDFWENEFCEFCEFFKKLKLHSPKRLVQFQLFEKHTRAN